MRLPTTIGRMYLDFDGFFASVEQQDDRRLRGRPIGIVPFEGTGHTCVIACSREAKNVSVKNVMSVADARRLCPDVVLVPQKPYLYRRAHNAMLEEIESVIPIDGVKSINELTCRLDAGLCRRHVRWSNLKHRGSARCGDSFRRPVVVVPRTRAARPAKWVHRAPSTASACTPASHPSWGSRPTT